MPPATVFICDPEPHVRECLRELLATRGHAAAVFDGPDSLLEALEQGGEALPDLVLVEADGPGAAGLDSLRRLRAAQPTLPVVVTSAFPTVRGAVAAMKLGAQDFLTKPVADDELVELVELVAERQRLVEENRSLKAEIRRRFDPDEVVVASPAFRRVFEMARRVAASEASVLVQGETGTGKELIASTIHYSSPRREQRFLTVNCAALTETLLESQLFGHVKGAFTGAVANQRGLVEEADGGTLFLDEIGDISPGLQVKLLRVIQEKEFLPVGSTRARRADVRFVAATNKDLEREVAAGSFREDLYYRLNVVTLEVPPLRERPEDVVPLAERFLQKYGARDQRLGTAVLERLRAYSWPGNVRELENVIEMAAVLSGEGEITPDHLPGKLADPAPSELAAAEEEPCSLEEVEARHIERVLRQTGYNKVRAAAILKISRTTLDRKIDRYGIRKEAG
ncbi:MAG: sigma-54 dependent transcriptional regulator [Deferrisomatales bacterium]